MMRRVVLFLALVLGAVAVVTVISTIRSAPRVHKVTMRFLCYTQDLVGFRPSQYQVPYKGSNNMAMFLLEKHSGVRTRFFHNHES